MRETRGAPDFYLTGVGDAGFGGELARVRACWCTARLRSDVRDDIMLAEVDPPLIVAGCGPGTLEIAEVVIATRLKGYTLFPVTEWGCSVYVSRLVDPVVARSLVITRPDQIEVLAWAEIYRTREDAEAEVEKARARYRYP